MAFLSPPPLPRLLTEPAVKETHPNEDLLGWFTTTDSPQFLPSSPHVAAHQDLLQYNESLVLLVLNPSPAAALGGGGKLPLAIYESIYEAEADTDGEADNAATTAAAAAAPATATGTATATATAATTATANLTMGLKFVPLNFTIESGEAEMIGMDFVAKGACNASSVPNSAIAAASALSASAGTMAGTPLAAITTTQGKSPEPTNTSKGKEKEREDKREDKKEKEKVKEGEQGKDKEKGKERGKDKDKDKESSGKVDVGPQNDELIANLTAKKNAITMLNARIKLLLHYLQNPPDGIPNHQILREIRSLTHSRLPLLRPAESHAFEQERLAAEGDVNLVVLLGAVTRSLEEVRSVGRKSAGIDHITRALKKSSYEDSIDFPGLLGGNNGGGAPGAGAGGTGRRLRSMMGGFAL